MPSDHQLLCTLTLISIQLPLDSTFGALSPYWRPESLKNNQALEMIDADLLSLRTVYQRMQEQRLLHVSAPRTLSADSECPLARLLQRQQPVPHQS